MALPETSITISAVRTALGESSYNLSDLRTSASINRWGFLNTTRGWGEILPVAGPYNLGDFRSYDHYWRCWAAADFDLTSTSPYYEQGLESNFSIRYFPSWSTNDNTDKVFTVYFKRTNDWSKGLGTLIDTYTLNSVTDFDVSFDFDNPPDFATNGVLDKTDDFYLLVRVTTVSDRRWDFNQSYVPETIYGYELPVTVPSKGWDYYTTISTANVVMYDTGTLDAMISTITFSDDSPNGSYITWLGQFCKSAAFDVDVVLQNDSFHCTGNSTPNQPPELSTDSKTSPLSNLFSVGDTVYYRFKITSSDNDFQTSWYTGSTTVLEEVPL